MLKALLLQLMLRTSVTMHTLGTNKAGQKHCFTLQHFLSCVGVHVRARSSVDYLRHHGL